MGREEEREILSGSKPEPASQIDLDAAGGDDSIEIPEPDRRGKSEDELPGSAFDRGDPEAVPTDLTDAPEYQAELAEARRQAKEGEAVLEDGRDKMPPTRYDRS